MITAARPTEERSAHFYTQDGRACYEVAKKSGPGMRRTNVTDARKLGLLPSPTTVLKQLAKPQLVNWQIEQGCLAVLTSPRRDGEQLDAFVHRVLHEDREQDAERDAAADMGTEIHNAIECALKGLPCNPNLLPYVNAVLEKIKPLGRVMFTEKILVGDGYAGRTDAGMENDTTITVLDFKGCNALPKAPYDEHKMQMAAYAAALGNTGDKIVQCANVYINRNIPGEVSVYPIWNWQDEYQKFRLLLTYWYLSNEVPLPPSLQ